MPLHGYVRYVTKKSLCTSLECLGVDGLAQNLGSTFARETRCEYEDLKRCADSVADRHDMALSVGSYVTLSGLKGRADLNERTGRILGAAKDGRLPIRVMDECNQVLCEVRVRMDCGRFM